MRNEIKATLEQHLVGLTMLPGQRMRFDDIDAAAEAIVEIVVAQPVDRVQAMALFVHHCESIPERHYTPDGYIVELYSNERELCFPDAGGGELCVDSPCEHIKAVRLYLAAQGEIGA